MLCASVITHHGKRYEFPDIMRSAVVSQAKEMHERKDNPNLVFYGLNGACLVLPKRVIATVLAGEEVLYG